MFSDDDLKGFKNIGEGSKSHDKTKIGQFGRGSQTMYHFTDAPHDLDGRLAFNLGVRCLKLRLFQF